MPVISFSCLIPLGKVSSTILDKYSCLVADIKGISLGFLQLTMVLAVIFSYLAFIILRYVPSITVLFSVVVFLILNKC